jgi:MFS transporter, ACS family, pantothenate transporter
MLGTTTLSVYPANNTGLMLFGWFMTYCETGAAALILAWLNEVCSFSAEYRLLSIGAVETFGFAMNAWVILFAYNSEEAPKFAVGYEMATMFFAIEIICTVIIFFCLKRWNPALKNREYFVADMRSDEHKTDIVSGNLRGITNLRGHAGGNTWHYLRA